MAATVCDESLNYEKKKKKKKSFSWFYLRLGSCIQERGLITCLGAQTPPSTLIRYSVLLSSVSRENLIASIPSLY